MKALAPGFLIAMPQLQDPNFKQSVVLMLEHGTHGSMGLVINRATKLTFGDLAKSQDLAVAPSRQQRQLFMGGPVEPYRGFVLHDSAAVEERSEVLPGLYLSVTSDSLGPLLLDEAVTLRFCLGYSGWGPGQVEAEMKGGSWLFTEAESGAVLREDPAVTWDKAIRGMGIDPGWLVTSGGVN